MALSASGAPATTTQAFSRQHPCHNTAKAQSTLWMNLEIVFRTKCSVILPHWQGFLACGANEGILLMSLCSALNIGLIHRVSSSHQDDQHIAILFVAFVNHQNPTRKSFWSLKHHLHASSLGSKPQCQTNTLLNYSRILA